MYKMSISDRIQVIFAFIGYSDYCSCVIKLYEQQALKIHFFSCEIIKNSKLCQYQQSKTDITVTWNVKPSSLTIVSLQH